MSSRLLPGVPHPKLQFATLSHGDYDIVADAPAGGTYLVFHRGGHCKWTRLMLKDLDDRIGDFALRGIRVAAVSGDGREAAEALKERMQLVRLPLGFGLNVAGTAAEWGLFTTLGSTEADAPDRHFEPAQAWVRQDGRLGALAVQSGPCLWPEVTNAIRAIEKTMSDFPERGTGASAR